MTYYNVFGGTLSLTQSITILGHFTPVRPRRGDSGLVCVGSDSLTYYAGKKNKVVLRPQENVRTRSGSVEASIVFLSMLFRWYCGGLAAARRPAEDQRRRRRKNIVQIDAVYQSLQEDRSSTHKCLTAVSRKRRSDEARFPLNNYAIA